MSALPLVEKKKKKISAGLYVYEPSEWEEKGLSGSDLADQDLKKVLEGLAKHLFGDVEVRRGFQDLYVNSALNQQFP